MKQVASFPRVAQEARDSDLQSLFRGAIRLVLESVLDQEVRELVGARRYERVGSRKDVLNGTYLRRLLTSMGEVEVRVPRTRNSGSPIEGVVDRYARRTEELDDTITAAYVQGVSTRDMGRVAEALTGKNVSRSTVSRVTKSLEAQVEALRTAPISGAFRYLYLDATFLDARWARAVESVSALVAYGVDERGHRQLLGVTMGAEESEASWTELLTQLTSRGLSGVELVIADGHSGLASAVRKLLPETRLQRCTVHLERNILTKAPHRLRGRLAGLVSNIFNAASLVDAKKQKDAFASGLGRELPEAMECLENGFAAATQFFAFPSAHWKRIRSTNSLERLHGEIKRRTRAVGAFPDRASALRLVTAVAIEASEIWSDRRYLDMSLFNKEASQTIAA
ncbi:MAG: IS256 family transposase [Polyangiaceae bacterium]